MHIRELNNKVLDKSAIKKGGGGSFLKRQSLLKVLDLKETIIVGFPWYDSNYRGHKRRSKPGG